MHITCLSNVSTFDIRPSFEVLYTIRAVIALIVTELSGVPYSIALAYQKHDLVHFDVDMCV